MKAICMANVTGNLGRSRQVKEGKEKQEQESVRKGKGRGYNDWRQIDDTETGTGR